MLLEGTSCPVLRDLGLGPGGYVLHDPFRDPWVSPPFWIYARFAVFRECAILQ